MTTFEIVAVTHFLTEAGNQASKAFSGEIERSGVGLARFIAALVLVGFGIWGMQQ